MKIYKCKTHGTIMKLNDKKENGNCERKINISFDDLGCLLPSMQYPKEGKLNNCDIVEVESNE